MPRRKQEGAVGAEQEEERKGEAEKQKLLWSACRVGMKGRDKGRDTHGS